MKGQQRPKRITHLTVLLALSASLLVNLPGGRASIVATQHAHAVVPSSRVPGTGAVQLPAKTATGSASTALRASYAHLPLRFELNEGQTDPRVRFLVHGGGSTIFLTNTEAVIAIARGTTSQSRALNRPLAESGVRAHVIGPPDMGLMTRGLMQEDVVRLGYVGANPHPRVVGLDRLPGVSNYFIGNDRTKWRTNVPGYARVELRDVYPGIDLVYYGRNGQLEYDWVLRPGADPRHIQLAVDGTTQVHIDAQGNAILQSGGVRMRQASPVIYQEVDGRKRPVSGHYVLAGHRQIGMAVGAYNTRARLVIDPVLVYATYLGGGGPDVGWGIALDRAGAAYVTGETASTDFPAAHALPPRFGGARDAFVVKFSPAGDALAYATYLGGSGEDVGRGIAVNRAGAAYVAGFTRSADFPTAHALRPRYGGATDAFVAKLSPAGNALAYATYLGGSGKDEGIGIAVDQAGAAYVAGFTTSADFPTANALQPRLGGGTYDVFVAKLSPAGNALAYATYLGGSRNDLGYGIAVDRAGAAYVTGFTTSADFPTANALQPRLGGNPESAFVAKLSPAGDALVYATYLGVNRSHDYGYDIAVDRAGAAYVTGGTVSADFPTANALQPRYGGATDAFVAKLTPAGNALVYATYLGGSGKDYGLGIAVDRAGAAYVTGFAHSADFPTTANARQPRFGGGGNEDAFVAKIGGAP